MLSPLWLGVKAELTHKSVVKVGPPTQSGASRDGCALRELSPLLRLQKFSVKYWPSVKARQTTEFRGELMPIAAVSRVRRASANARPELSRWSAGVHRWREAEREDVEHGLARRGAATKAGTREAQNGAEFTVTPPLA